MIRWLARQNGWRLTIVLYGFCGSVMIAVLVGLGFAVANMHRHPLISLLVVASCTPLMAGMAAILRYGRHVREAGLPPGPK